MNLVYTMASCNCTRRQDFFLSMKTSILSHLLPHYSLLPPPPSPNLSRSQFPQSDSRRDMGPPSNCNTARVLSLPHLWCLVRVCPIVSLRLKFMDVNDFRTAPARMVAKCQHFSLSVPIKGDFLNPPRNRESYQSTIVVPHNSTRPNHQWSYVRLTWSL